MRRPKNERNIGVWRELPYSQNPDYRLLITRVTELNEDKDSVIEYKVIDLDPEL